MCGIAGFVARGKADGGVLAGMLAREVHRGPDGHGVWTSAAGEWHASLGHRRLAIIDLEMGAQPMVDARGVHGLAYNGEVYNFRELGRAYELRTHSDTEVVLRHVERRGAEAIGEFNGMFAFAFWDAEDGSLLLGRDRAGIKPLYYASLPDGGLAFASELEALLAHPGVSRAVDPKALAAYFFCDYVPPPLAMVAGVRKLPPGHHVTWRRGQVSAPARYWTPAAPSARLGFREAADELERRLTEAVERHLIADVPVGMFLSGGLDSSTIAAFASERAPGRMKAFSIGFSDATFDESGYARAVASHLRVEHVVESLTEKNLLDVVDRALAGLDEPLADPSLLPTYLLSQLAARSVKVVVSGDGGDELVAGYPTVLAHSAARVYGAMPGAARRAVSAVVDRLPIDHRYQSVEWKIRRFVHRFSDDDVERHLRWMSNVDLPDLTEALEEPVRGLPFDVPELPATSDRLHRILALDFSTYMSGSVLTKVDRASMAHSLEVRPPLLDNAVVDFAFAQPSRHKLRGTTTKALLKAVARKKLPTAIVDRPKKGFGIPLARWLRGPLADRARDVCARSPAWDAGLRQRTFQRWLAEHHAMKADRSKPLWALLVLDAWLRS